jgi:hypothetical protein
MFSTTNDNNDLSNKVVKILQKSNEYFLTLMKKVIGENQKLKAEMEIEHEAMRAKLKKLKETNIQLKTDLDRFNLLITSINNQSYHLFRAHWIGKVWVPKSYQLSFNIKPYATVEDWGSIMHFTTNGLHIAMGSRNPAIYFCPKSTKLHVRLDTDKANDGIWETSELPLNMVSKVTITRHKGDLVVWINDKVDQSYKFDDRSSSPALSTFFAGDPWLEPAKAELTNVTLVEYQPR